MPKKKDVEDKKDYSIDTKSIEKNIMAYVDTELDKRLEKVVSDKVRKEVIDEIDKSNKRLIRLKNRKIFIKNILLIIFLAIIVFLTYLLYTEGYFDKYFNHNKNNDENVVVEEKNENVEVLPSTLDELKEEYASYLDSYVISDKCLYIEDFYNGKLTNELKNYLTLNAIDFSKLEVEDDYNLVDSSVMNEVCNQLLVDKCTNVNFDYNGNKIRYFDKLKSYITNSLLERDESIIQREIIDINVSKKIVKITTVEGIVVDDQLYSISPNNLIGEYYGEGLVNYQDNLNKVVYTFNNKKLASIERG